MDYCSDEAVRSCRAADLRSGRPDSFALDAGGDRAEHPAGNSGLCICCWACTWAGSCRHVAAADKIDFDLNWAFRMGRYLAACCGPSVHRNGRHTEVA